MRQANFQIYDSPSRAGRVVKTPTETITVYLDYAKWLESGETLSTVSASTATVTSPAMTFTATLESTTVVKLVIAAGADLYTYNAEVSVTTSAAQTKEDFIVVVVRDIASATLPATLAAEVSAQLLFNASRFRLSTLAELTALQKSLLQDDDSAFVNDSSTGGMFYWDAESTAADDGATVLEADEGGTGRWLLALSNSNTTAYTPGGTDVAVADGGTGASTAIDARANLGLDDMATQNAGSVTITGGDISGTTVTLRSTAAPAPTTEGEIWWDSDDDQIKVGDGAATKTFSDDSVMQAAPAEGPFVDGDKTKLDGIETAADVTDTANVTAAGALMDSEVADLAGIKALDTSTLQVKPAEGAFVDGDKTKLDAAILDGDFSTNGLMERTGAGAYGTATDGTDYISPSTGLRALDSRTAIKGAGLSAGQTVYNREAGYEGPFTLTSGNYTGLADEYAILTDDSVAIGTGAWVKKYYRPPRPQDFGAATGSLGTPDGIQRAIDYAAANIGEVLFDAQYVINGPVDLADNMRYIGTPQSLIDGSQASVGSFYTSSAYSDGILQAVGSQGSQIALDRDITPILSSSINGNFTRSSTTASVTTYGYHGFSTGDYVYVIFAAGYPSMPPGPTPDPTFVDYLTQGGSTTEQMAWLTPVQVTVTGNQTFTYTVDSGATTPLSASSVWVFKAHNLIKTGSAHGLSVGDWVELDTNVAVPVLSGSQTIDYAEKARVIRVLDTTTAIIDGQVKYEQLTSNSAAMRKLNLLSYIEMDGVRVKGVGSTETVTTYDGDTGIALDLIDRAVLKDVYVEDCELFGINVQRYGSVDMVRPRVVANFTDDGGRVSGVTKYPYAICYGGHGNSLRIDSPVILGNPRHGISEATDGTRPGVTDYVDIISPYIVGPISSGIAVHYPNDGYNVRGGFISTVDGWGIDVRAGNFMGSDVRGRGGWGLLGVSGHPNNIECNNFYTQDCMRDAYYFSTTVSGSYDERAGDFINLTNMYAKNCRRVIYMFFASGSGRGNVTLHRIGGDNTEFTGVYCSFDSTNKGKFTARDVHITNVNRYNGVGYLIELLNSDDYDFENLGGSEGANASSFVPYTLTNCTNGYMRKIQDYPGVTTNISSGTLTLTRSDDHDILVRGEGGTADNLDAISGLQQGQRITLFRYSETITIRDSGTSGLGTAGIQITGGSSISLDGPYKSVTILGTNISGYAVVVNDTQTT